MFAVPSLPELGSRASVCALNQCLSLLGHDIMAREAWLALAVGGGGQTATGLEGAPGFSQEQR